MLTTTSHRLRMLADQNSWQNIRFHKGPKHRLRVEEVCKDRRVPPLSTECTDNTFICGTTHTDRRIICTGYEPDYVSGFGGVDGDCYQYADFGPWLTICQNIESLCSHR